MPGTAQILQGRIAVVTGASSGIGAAVVRQLAREGAAVVANARRQERLENLTAELEREGCRVMPFAGDCTQEQVVIAMLDAARRAFGSDADLVVANAGKGLNGSLLTSDVAEWDKLFRLNIFSSFLLMRHAAQRMIKLSENTAGAGKARDIVALSSCVGRNVVARSAVYSATKFAVAAAAEALRREVCSHGIRVSMIEPGVVETEFFESAGYDEAKFKELFGHMLPVLKAEDVARSIGFIVSQPSHVHIHDIAIRPVKQEYP